VSDLTPNPGQLMQTADILQLLPVGERQLRNLINNKGLPCQGSGTRRSFVWAEVLEWYVDYRLGLAFKDGNGGNEDGSDEDGISESGGNGREDIRQATLRKTRAEANIKELQLSRLRGEVIAIADAKTRVDRMMGNLRSHLLGMAAKLASRTEGMQRTEREAAIKDELESLCRELSTGAIVEIADDPAEVDLTASAAELPNVEVLGLVANLLEEYG